MIIPVLSQLSLEIGGTREDVRGRACPDCPATKRTLRSYQWVIIEKDGYIVKCMNVTTPLAPLRDCLGARVIEG
jgi:hypothetical protein